MTPNEISIRRARLQAELAQLDEFERLAAATAQGAPPNYTTAANWTRDNAAAWAATMNAEQILAAWDALLMERHGIPPNDRHAEITAILDTLNARLKTLWGVQ